MSSGNSRGSPTHPGPQATTTIREATGHLPEKPHGRWKPSPSVQRAGLRVSSGTRRGAAAVWEMHALQHTARAWRGWKEQGRGEDSTGREDTPGNTGGGVGGGWQLTIWEPPPRPRPGSPVVFEPSLVADGDTAGCKRLGAGQPEAAGGCFPLTLSQMKWLPGLASQSCLNGKRPVSPMEH